MVGTAFMVLYFFATITNWLFVQFLSTKINDNLGLVLIIIEISLFLVTRF